MKLNRYLYIEPRTDGRKHLSLDGKWAFSYTEQPNDQPSTLSYEHEATLPKAVGWCLYEAGILPHPYERCNSREYRFMHHRVWYFRRRFDVPSEAESLKYAYLCFDGVAYYSRVWLNGQLLGEHEGMFGGPVTDVHALLRYGETNELVVECVPCNMDYDDSPLTGKITTYSQPSSIADTSVIAPWQLMNDSLTTTGEFSVIGIWRSVRIEFLPAYHMNNPFLYTRSIAEDQAELQLEVPITNPYMHEQDGMPGSQTTGFFAFEWVPKAVSIAELTDRVTGKDLKLRIELMDPDGCCIVDTVDPVTEYDLSMLGKYPFADYTFFRKKIRIRHSRLWSPMENGEQPLYTVRLTLNVDGHPTDEAEWKTGIRTVTVTEASGPKMRRIWGDYQFVVNGEPVFLKGMNFTEMDQMLLQNDEDYRWVLRLAKNAGIQMIRLWSGGNAPESDLFYRECDRLGIMVWQDSFLANNTSRKWDTNVLRDQLGYYLYRIRNHASFVLHCGGNEFDPYSQYNAASMFAIRNESDRLIPDRIFFNATQDGADLHPYEDMEPTWYRHIYKCLPFLSESGVHGFPTYKILKQVLSPEETTKPIGNIMDASFSELFPDMRNHFSEFSPDRVPRMLARASHIQNLKGIRLKELCEASHMASYEFYLIMAESMMENSPVTTGIMPWVFKRPYPTTAIQLVDAYGNPEWQYYGLKRAYEPIHPYVALGYLNYRPGENVEMPIKVFSEQEDAAAREVRIAVLDREMKTVLRKSYMLSGSRKGNQMIDTLQYSLPEQWEDLFFFIRIQIWENEELVGESLYTPKVLSCLKNEEQYRAERKWPCSNLYFDHGPWLKDQVAGGGKAVLRCEILSESRTEQGYAAYRLRVSNESGVPAYPVVVDSVDDRARVMCSDNAFLLMGGEDRIIQVTVDDSRAETSQMTISAWNADEWHGVCS